MFIPMKTPLVCLPKGTHQHMNIFENVMTLYTIVVIWSWTVRITQSEETHKTKLLSILTLPYFLLVQKHSEKGATIGPITINMNP